MPVPQKTADFSSSNGNNDLPFLRYLDQTPIVRNENKRLCSVLSPLNENEKDFTAAIESAIEKSFEKLLPSLVLKIQSSLQESIQQTLNEAVAKIRSEIWDFMTNGMNCLERRMDLKVKCETELVESYNRRDNVRIIGLPEEPERTTEGNRTLGEPPETTMRKVVDIANIIGASVTANDISFAHWLPSRADKEKPIIVKFARRIGKINLSKNKKELAKKPNVQHVKVDSKIY